MPVSMPIFDDLIELYFRHAPHDVILDIGPGAGKHGQMIRRARPQSRLIGVEIDPEYVEQYKLRDIYDEVWLQDAANLMDDPRRTYSAVLISDCIEHMRKSVGVDLLHFLVYRAKIILVKFPLQMVQNAWQGHASEAHRSVWDERDFAPFDHIFLRREPMCLCLIRGYLSQAIEWLPRPVLEQLGFASMADYYNQEPARWRLADFETRRREQAEAEINAIIPPTARFILADEEQSGFLASAGPRRIPFAEHDGQFWGVPGDDSAAIAELERQRAAGARFIVFAYPSMWILTRYPAFVGHLDGQYRRVIANDRVVIYDLRR